MTKYIIDEQYFADDVKLYSMEDVLYMQRPLLTKFLGRTDTAQGRIVETWKFLGPVTKMRDKVGHRFSTILLRNLKDTFGEAVKLRLMSVAQARSFNSKYYSSVRDGMQRVRRGHDGDQDQHGLPQAEAMTMAMSAVTELRTDSCAKGRSASTTKADHTDRKPEPGRPFMFGLTNLFKQESKRAGATSTSPGGALDLSLSQGALSKDDSCLEDVLKFSDHSKRRYYFKGKHFSFQNLYFNYDQKHNCLRLIDVDLIVFDKQSMHCLDIIKFIH